MARSLFKITSRLSPTWQPQVMFDVGANKGNTTRWMKSAYPDVAVHCFEPVPAAYLLLEEATRALTNVTCHQIALSSKRMRAMISTDGASTGNSFQDAPKAKETTTVRTEMGDTFCHGQQIEQIDFLKIDTEGHDMDVLLGFRTMIAARRVDLIQVEVSLNPENRRHVDLTTFRGFLEPQGYRIFHMQSMAHERRNRPVLRRGDVIFISPRLAKAAKLEK
jgi:FkbM family methyltransferase